MKISVDVGALCSKDHFGNYILTVNLIKAISLYDHKNQYYLYSFCDQPAWLNINKNIYYQKLIPRIAWMSLRVPFEEAVNKKEIFLALNQSIPRFTSAKIISFSHGLSFHFYPQYYPDSYQKLKQQLEGIIKRSSYIIVSSQKVKDELVSIYRLINTKIVVIPFGIPFDMLADTTLVRPHQSGKEKFFLYVGMDHPIKNIKFISRAFKEFIKDKRFADYKFYCFQSIKRERLKELYQKATAYLTASHYESFNLPVLEALSCGCPVVGLKSAIIPELKKYVYEAANLKSFVQGMRLTAAGKVKDINLGELRREFSWKTYVNRLTTLY